MRKNAHPLWLILSFLLLGCALKSTKNFTTPDYLLIPSVDKLSSTLTSQKVFFRSTETDANGFVTNYLIASMDLTYEKTLNAKWSDMNLSTDGRYLIYTTSIEGNKEEVHRLDLLTTEDRTLFDSSRIPGEVTYLGIENPSLSPDGEKVIFRVNITGEKFGLGVYSIKDDSIKIITTEGFNSQPEFSANDKKILSICEGRDALGFQICIMESDGSNRQRLTDVEGYHDAWLSPDGKHIVYQHTLTKFFGDPVYTLYTMEIDGSNIVPLYNKSVHFLTFSTDGKDIVFCPFRENENICEGIYVIGLDGLNLRKLAYFDEEFLSKWK